MFATILIIAMLLIIIISVYRKPYRTNEFSRSILVPDLKLAEGTDTEQLLTRSSLVDVKYIHSGNIKVRLSNAINLKHPACSGMEYKEIEVPIFAYVVHHKKYGYFMIDSGCEASYAEDGYGPMKGLIVPLVMPKTYMEAGDAIENQLPEEVLHNIKAVFFTHLHFDHTSGLPALDDNLIYIAGKGERSYSIKWALEVNHFKRSDTLYHMDFDADIAKTFPIGKAIDVFGDQTFWAISTPGHTKGHTSYLVNTKDKSVFIAGDACILNQGLELGVGPGPAFTDIGLAQKTLDRICAFVRSNPDVEVWCGHDFPK